MDREFKFIHFPNGKKLRYSACINCELSNASDKFTISIGSDRWGIPYATTNMQNDYADFEGIAFAVWSVLPECDITLQFDSLKWSLTDGNFPIDYKEADKEVLKSVNAYNKHVYDTKMENDKKKGEVHNRQLTVKEELESHTPH